MKHYVVSWLIVAAMVTAGIIYPQTLLFSMVMLLGWAIIRTFTEEAKKSGRHH